MGFLRVVARVVLWAVIVIGSFGLAEAAGVGWAAPGLGLVFIVTFGLALIGGRQVGIVPRWLVPGPEGDPIRPHGRPGPG